MRITGNVFLKALAAVAACGLFACASEGGSEEPTTEQSRTEPTLLAGEGATADDDRGAVDDGRDIARATGASARAISFNHPEPHTLVIPARDLSELRGGRYVLTAGGGALGELHTHEVDVSAQELAEIADGAEITFESTAGGPRGGHTHYVTISRR